MSASPIEQLLQAVSPSRSGDARSRAEVPFDAVLKRTTEDRPAPRPPAAAVEDRAAPPAADERPAAEPPEKSTISGDADQSANDAPADGNDAAPIAAAGSGDQSGDKDKETQDEVLVSEEAAAAATTAPVQNADTPPKEVKIAIADATQQEKSPAAGDATGDHQEQQSAASLTPADTDAAEVASAEAAPDQLAETATTEAGSAAATDAAINATGGAGESAAPASESKAKQATAQQKSTDAAAAANRGELASATQAAAAASAGIGDQPTTQAKTPRAGDAQSAADGAAATKDEAGDSAPAARDRSRREEASSKAAAVSTEVSAAADETAQAADLAPAGDDGAGASTARAPSAGVANADTAAGDAAGGGRATTALDRIGVPRSVHAPAAERAGGDMSGVDRGRYLQRVGGAIRLAEQRDGRVQVRLSPPELGSLRIELTVQNGVLHANVETETNSARTLLLDNLPALRERLAQQDIRVEKFDVNVGRDGQHQHGAPQDRESPWREPGQPGGQQRRRDQSQSRVPRSAARAAGATSPSPTGGDDGLDVRV
ncbi:MAG: flagellar hook-length control protein FliK [Planctomycetales bacterium]|nr:flagellar hook-length control protein FliK [Planctomycetales bacterium]